MSKVEFNIGDWRNKHIVKEGVGGVVSRNPFGKMSGMFRTEAVDHIDDEEANKTMMNYQIKILITMVIQMHLINTS